jgi:hypothetical protein
MKILSTTASAFHGEIKRQNREEIEKIDEAIAFLKANPDLNLFSVDEKTMEDLADVIRSALNVYSKEILELAEKHEITEFKNAKSDIFSKYDKAPNKKGENREKHEFFISYSSKDKKLARQIRDIIFEHSFAVFLAHRDIPMSKGWREEILSHLKSCTTLVALCTKNYKCSTWGNQEIGIGFEKGKKIIPLFYQGTTKSDFGFLETFQGPSGEISEDNVLEIVENVLSSIDLISTENVAKAKIKSIAKERIKEDLIFIRKLVVEDLKKEAFATRGYPVDLLSTFSDELVREIGVEKFRKVQKTYTTINSLGFRSNEQNINKQNYEKAIRLIDKTLELLTK